MPGVREWKAALEYEEKVLQKVLEGIEAKVKKDKPPPLARHFIRDWVKSLHHGSKHPGKIKNMSLADIEALLRAENQVLAGLLAALPTNTDPPVEKWRDAFTITMDSNNYVLKFLGRGQPDSEGLETLLDKLS